MPSLCTNWLYFWAGTRYMSDLEVMQSAGIMNSIVLLGCCQITRALKVHGQMRGVRTYSCTTGMAGTPFPPSHHMGQKKFYVFVLICHDAHVERWKPELFPAASSPARAWKAHECGVPLLPLSHLWNSGAISPPVLNKNKAQNGWEKAAHREFNSELLQALFWSTINWELGTVLGEEGMQNSYRKSITYLVEVFVCK